MWRYKAAEVITLMNNATEPASSSAAGVTYHFVYLLKHRYVRGVGKSYTV